MNTPTSSSARVAANQENAQKSCGPITAEGKEKSSRNAITHALTGRTVVLPTEDLALYERHLAAYQQKFQPATAYETLLVQSIADTDWRLSRIPQLILALQDKACLDMADEFQDLDPASRHLRLELEGFLKYEKQLRNLQLQETRLHRRREKDLAELRIALAERQAERQQQLAAAAELYAAASRENKSFVPADHGFVFSLAEIQSYGQHLRAAVPAKQLPNVFRTAPAAA